MDFLTGWAGVAVGAFASGLLLTTLGAKVVVKLLNKLPWEKIEKWFYRLGVLQTTLCRSKMGKKFYEPLEKFINEKIQHCLNQYFEGTRSDNVANGGGHGQKSQEKAETGL